MKLKRKVSFNYKQPRFRKIDATRRFERPLTDPQPPATLFDFMTNRWLAGLNPEQVEAALHNYGPLLILAGAGSGKTTVLVGRTGRLLDEKIVEPSRLCVLTFTNKAARELKTRVGVKLGKIANKVWAGTFHSFGLMLLRKHHEAANLPKDFGVLDSGDASGIVKELLKDFHYGDKTAYDSERVLSMMSSWRERKQVAAKTADEYEAAVEFVLPKYLRRLELLGMIDFDGLILKPIELMDSSSDIRQSIQSSYDQMMVDEFQDTNMMQMHLVRTVTEKHHNLSVVGDDDQSIYGWRGACVRNILDFPKLYSECKVVRLERNYRSTPEILNLANAIIAKNEERHKKVLRPSAEKSGPRPELLVYADENEEAESVGSEINEAIRNGAPKRDVAVLYRSNSQGAFLEAELRRQGIPYYMTGGQAFFDRREIRDCIAYLRCALKPNEISFRRIINTPARGIGEKSIESLTVACRERKIPFIEMTRRWAECGIDAKTGESIQELFTLLSGLVGSLLVGPSPAGDLFLRRLDQLGYRKHLDKTSANALVATKRWKFIEVFCRILDRYLEKNGKHASTVRDFVDAMELRDNLADKEEDEDRVQLLTLHACKGLEFPVVFLMGIEEDILPHKLLGSDLSEERRLFYVGVTRAKDRLFLTRAEKRKKHGRVVDSPPSRFLLEIEKTLVQERRGPKIASADIRKSMISELFKKLDGIKST